MAERLAARPEILRVRRDTVEHPFGTIKKWMNQCYFLMRGLERYGSVQLRRLRITSHGREAVGISTMLAPL